METIKSNKVRVFATLTTGESIGYDFDPNVAWDVDFAERFKAITDRKPATLEEYGKMFMEAAAETALKFPD